MNYKSQLLFNKSLFDDIFVLMIVDLHIHSNISDGTDTPEEILELAKQANIRLFSITDHDDISGCLRLLNVYKETDIKFITGVELSCSDIEGKYHILGYNFDVNSPYIRELVKKTHDIRIGKTKKRLELLKKEFGIIFPDNEISDLFLNENPGKPHLANLMVKYGYSKTKEEAISGYIDKLNIPENYINPSEAISNIVKSGGIPVLAHPSYGSGDQFIVGEDMNSRLKKLIHYGLKGVEVFYSGFTVKLINEMLFWAKKYNLFATAGSDYHGKNKLTAIGETGLSDVDSPPVEMLKFFKMVNFKMK